MDLGNNEGSPAPTGKPSGNEKAWSLYNPKHINDDRASQALPSNKQTSNRTANGVGARAAVLASDPRIARQAEHLFSLGPRAVLEFVAEAAARLDGQSTIARMLDAYARLEHRQLNATGGDRIVRPPLRVVRTRGAA